MQLFPLLGVSVHAWFNFKSPKSPIQPEGAKWLSFEAFSTYTANALKDDAAFAVVDVAAFGAANATAATPAMKTVATNKLITFLIFLLLFLDL